MSGEEIRAREEFGALGGCFVEGDPQQRRCERRVKRRALALSISLQFVALAAVILLPLLGQAERISLAIATPIPPYRHYSGSEPQRPRMAPQQPRPSCRFCFTTHFLPVASPHDNRPSGQPEGPAGNEIAIPGTGGADNIRIVDTRNSTPPPPQPTTPRRIVMTSLQPAMLIHRVEPAYPNLARQTRREGKVELHAIVATDGTIQSLQVISGDTLFVQSALDAVTQWRYRPTILNGLPVEVDTTITVVYTLAH